MGSGVLSTVARGSGDRPPHLPSLVSGLLPPRLVVRAPPDLVLSPGRVSGGPARSLHTETMPTQTAHDGDPGGAPPPASGAHPSLDELLVATSRTFAPGIHALRPSLRRPIGIAYLVLRVSDFLEDTTSLADGDKVDLLEAWAEALGTGTLAPTLRRVLEGADDGTPDALAANHVARVFEALRALEDGSGEIVARHTASSTLGMARWIRHGPQFETEAELDDYMHEVAGKVGLLLTDLFLATPGVVRAPRDRMMHLANEFGLALQTVNVIRGLHEDIHRGWDFVPTSFRGSPPGPRDDPAVLRAFTEKAERHVRAGVSYIRGLERLGARDVRFFCALPLFLAAGTLRLSRGNPRVFREPVKLQRSQVGRTVMLTRMLASSDRWVRWYGLRLLGSTGRDRPDGP